MICTLKTLALDFPNPIVHCVEEVSMRYPVVAMRLPLQCLVSMAFSAPSYWAAT
jgi:hypothetical protein